MSDYYCSSPDIPSPKEARIRAALAIDASEKFAQMLWEEGELQGSLQHISVDVYVRRPDELIPKWKYTVTTQTKTIFVARERR